MRLFALSFLLAFAGVAHCAVSVQAQALPVMTVPAVPKLIVLAYHDVRDDVSDAGDRDSDATSTDHLIADFDWLYANGYHMVSLDDVIAASHGERPLPDKAVLLTFDDGLESFYTRAYPLLRAYHYPALAALVGAWIDMPSGEKMDYNGGTCDRSCFLTWNQVHDMQASGLVEFASHSYDLHHGITGNPQGNQMPAAVTLAYDGHTGTYESKEQYTARIRADFRRSADEIAAQTGHRPRAIVWPYGAYSQVATDAARLEGMEISLSLSSDLPALEAGQTIPRLLLSDNVSVIRFAWLIRHQGQRDPVHAVQIDLDYVYDPDPAQQERNLSRLLDRIKRLKPTQVWLQAYADPQGDGLVRQVYFPNRHLPMRADLFSRVAWQLRTRAGVKVYAWLPVLSYRFPSAVDLPTLGHPDSGKDRDPVRLAPWDPKVRQMIGDVYEDLAMHADEAGLLFSDDAFIRDTDDLGPWDKLTAAQRTDKLIAFTQELSERVKRWRPQVRTARNIYARPVLQPDAEAWFAQSLPAFVAAYDMTALMAMPQLDKAADNLAWYRRLAKAVAAQPGGLDRTLFELATHDWQTGAAVPTGDVTARMRLLQAAGARNIGYYPDDFVRNHPGLEAIRPSISDAVFPYEEK
jgi:biofilm PGA synthesis lipoprotein PgaB